MKRPSLNPEDDIHNPSGLRLLTRSRLGQSHLNEHKSNQIQQIHNANPLCTCSLEIESTSHFFLHCIIVIRRNPSLETRAACTGFSIQLSVHVQT